MNAPRSSVRGYPRLHIGIAVAAAATLFAGLLSGGAHAQSVDSTLELFAGATEITVERFPGEPLYLDLGMFVAARGAPFEIRVGRTDYTVPVTMTQVIRTPAGEELRPLPSDLMEGWAGLKDFFTISIANDAGIEVANTTATFCPNGYYQERVDDSGPTRPSYPPGCYGSPFTKGMVWGIDQGWAVNPFSYEGTQPVRLKVGHYNATVSIAENYLELFDIDPSMATASVGMTVEKFEDGCIKCPIPVHDGHRAGASPPVLDDPDPSILPDLIALPAWGISVSKTRRGKEFLNFGATVWAGGASSMVVEGFRRRTESVMDAYQYFYDGNGEVLGKAPVGELEYDPRNGHQHWHFLQFARYSLLDGGQQELVRSKKEAFCLAPTDPIDLSLPNADINPGEIGLGTACGGQTSIWTREVLPLGWGDTYFQGLPGQSFNITNLPNGTYYISVEANPGGGLYEQTADNNVELREIILYGGPGRRRVEVPPWNGIDTEAGYGGGGGGEEGPIFD